MDTRAKMAAKFRYVASGASEFSPEVARRFEWLGECAERGRFDGKSLIVFAALSVASGIVYIARKFG